ncbi:MAG: alpha/beta hydrolase [Acidimicrobiia bacterium]|nr:alpha/beta hydrolase [Acidimicrobiia bacterium]
MTPGPTVHRICRGGLTIRVLDWGGDGEPLLLLHPNGFCAGLFEPMARVLTGPYRPIAVDLRGHGGTGVPDDPEGLAWTEMAADAASVLDALGVTEAVAVGQSLGGGVTVLLDRARPGLLRRALLCEAIAVPDVPDIARSNPLAEGARRRRAVWPDRASMVAAYSKRAPLSELAPEALEAYVAWGTVERGDGTVELACRPETEAALFEMAPTPVGGRGAWDHLADLSTEVVVLAGRSTSLPNEMFRWQAERAGVPLVLVEGGHFLLQEDTARGAALVREHLGG